MVNDILYFYSTLKTGFTKCFDRQNKGRRLRQQYYYRELNSKAEQKLKRIKVRIIYECALLAVLLSVMVSSNMTQMSLFAKGAHNFYHS